MNGWERDHLVAELGGMIQQAAPQVQERFLWHLFMIHDDYGTRVGEYIGKTADDVRHLEPLPSQRFTEDETKRLQNLGSNSDALDASQWGDWTSSVINHQVTAEEVLQGLGSLEYSR
ncbi:catalase-related domain-containing protein [Nesterenkonia lacusekhoensis]|nr:catalase-related domain-containing protein [Nesterenkonia lacusekhoensis]